MAQAKGLLATLLLLLMSAAYARAQDQISEPTLTSWDALALEVAPYDDPFIDMSIDQKMDLRKVLEAAEAQGAGQGNSALQANANGARARLNAAGLDVDFLLEQRLVVMERRRAEATGVTATYLDKEVLIDGHVLPLKWENERVTEFLLVPWVGACIHTPPPPPNQIIHVSYPEGLTVKRRFDALRLSGKLRHEAKTHDLFLIDGSRKIPASYQLTGAKLIGAAGKIVAASADNVDLPVFARLQLWISRLFTSGMTAIGEGKSATAILVAFLISFAYGALHTLGPGHGKAIVISYFVGTGGSLGRGLKMGCRIAVFHVLSAVVVVFLFDLALRQTTGASPSDYRAIKLASYGLITVVGCVMMWQAVRAVRVVRATPAHGRHNHDHAAHDHHSHDHAHAGCAACAAASSQRGGGWVAAAVGSVPCTGALLVMLFGLANDLVVPAVFMVIAISAGMAVAMSAIGIAALWGRGWVETRFAPSDRGRTRFELGARMVGAACVLVIGLLLFNLTYWHQPTSNVLTSGLAAQQQPIGTPEG